MLLSRVLGTVGRTFITFGVMTLLFVAYQLWGTGLLTAQAQAALENDFEALLEQAETVTPDIVAVGDGEVAGGAGADPGAATVVDDGTFDETTATPEEIAARIELANLLWQPEGDAVAQLLIPDIGITKTVVAGVGVDALRKGPGHYSNTPLPGQPGNASVAGHRTTWGAPFNRIDELEPGDEITVRTVQGTFVYRVIEQENGKGHFIVSPDRVDVLDQDFEDAPNRLTLTACHPKFSARQRIIVVAELVGEPAENIPRPASLPEPSAGLASEDLADDGEPDLPGDPDLIAADEAADAEADPDDDADAQADGAGAVGDDTPSGDAEAAPTEIVITEEDPLTDADLEVAFQGTEDAENFGEGLNGDSEAVVPAIMWGIAAAAIWISMGFASRRWKKWPPWAIGIIPFAAVLFVCFVNIDKALPSY